MLWPYYGITILMILSTCDAQIVSNVSALEMTGFDRYRIPTPSGLPYNTSCTTNYNQTQQYCEVAVEHQEDCINLCSHTRSDCASAVYQADVNICFIILDSATECNDLTVLNIQQAHKWGGSGWESNSGELFSWTFKKRYSFTDVYVAWMGNLRAARLQSGYSNSWYFTFNGASTKCASGSIDFANYESQRKEYNKHGEFGGYCKNLAAGDVRIGFYVTKAPSNAHGDANTAWYSYAKIIFEEVDTRNFTVTSTCPGLSLFNMKEYIRQNMNDGRDTGTIMEYHYEKRASDSAIRVRFIGSMHHAATASRCIKYSIQFNGEECSNPNPINGLVAYFTGGGSEYRTQNLEGICQGFPAGIVKIRLQVGACTQYSTVDGYTGYDSYSRLQMEEVRIGLPAINYRWIDNPDDQGTLYSDSETQSTSTYNIQHWTWTDVNSDLNEGQLPIGPVTYNKISTLSGLKVVFSATLRQWKRSYCTRWFIKFNGEECVKPNPGGSPVPRYIEGHIYVYNWDDGANQNHHRPYTISGICGYVGSGPIELSVHLGTCHSNALGDAYTGFLSSTVALSAEEVMYTEI